MRAVVVLLLLAGCDQLFQLNRLPEPEHHDARVDSTRVDSPRMIDGADDGRPDAALAVCTTAGIACSGITLAFTCGQTCFVTCTDDVTWSTADGRCSGSGVTFAKLDSQPIDDCVSMHLSENMWIGLEQLTNSPFPAVGWHWTADGAALQFTNWRPNEPNDNDGNEDGAENCAYATTGGGWNDDNCGFVHGFVCQR